MRTCPTALVAPFCTTTSPGCRSTQTDHLPEQAGFFGRQRLAGARHRALGRPAGKATACCQSAQPMAAITGAPAAARQRVRLLPPTGPTHGSLAALLQRRGSTRSPGSGEGRVLRPGLGAAGEGGRPAAAVCPLLCLQKTMATRSPRKRGHNASFPSVPNHPAHIRVQLPSNCTTAASRKLLMLLLRHKHRLLLPVAGLRKRQCLFECWQRKLTHPVAVAAAVAALPLARAQQQQQQQQHTTCL